MMKTPSIPHPSKNLNFASNLASVLLAKALNHQAEKYTPSLPSLPSLSKRYGRVSEMMY